MNPAVKVFITTGVFDDLEQAVTGCALVCGTQSARVDKRAGHPIEHPAVALLYAAVVHSQKNGAAECVEGSFKEARRNDKLSNLPCRFYFDKLDSIEKRPVSREVLVQRAQQRDINDAGPLVLMAARRRMEERRAAHTGTSSFRWHQESPWLALNRRIAQGEWARPTYSWMAQHR